MPARPRPSHSTRTAFTRKARASILVARVIVLVVYACAYISFCVLESLFGDAASTSGPISAHKFNSTPEWNAVNYRRSCQNKSSYIRAKCSAIERNVSVLFSTRIYDKPTLLKVAGSFGNARLVLYRGAN